MVIDKFKDQVPIGKRLAWSGLPSSNFYSKAKDGRPGRKPSATTLKTDGTTVEICCVVDEIKSILGIEFLCYGYVPVTDELFDRGFLINHKKVYRIMSENRLLCGKVIVAHAGKRQFFRFRKISGIVNYANSIEYDLNEVARQLMYTYYRNKTMIQKKLLATIDQYEDNGDLCLEEHEQEFFLEGYDSEDGVAEILELFESDSEFRAVAILQYRISQASDFLGIKLGNIDSTINQYQKGFQYKKVFEKKFGRDSYPMVKPGSQII